MFRSARVFLLATALIVPALAVHQAASASTLSQRKYGSNVVGPKAYYLALGDSLAFGYQPLLDWRKGYADDWFNNALQQEGTQSLVDMGCNGETTTTFINGECAFRIHKYPYSNKLGQLQAALKFIKDHPGQVSPVTIDIGANDIVTGLNPSTCAVVTDTQVITAIEERFNTNYTSILSQLKQALTVNGTMTGDLFTMNYYNPYQDKCVSNPEVAALFARFNNELAADAQQVGVPVADVYTAFGGAGNSNGINPNITGTPDGTCPANRKMPTRQAYTWMCTPFNQLSIIHPTTLGYQQIEKAFQALAGY